MAVSDGVERSGKERNARFDWRDGHGRGLSRVPSPRKANRHASQQPSPAAYPPAALAYGENSRIVSDTYMNRRICDSDKRGGIGYSQNAVLRDAHAQPHDVRMIAADRAAQ
jgi:hypothetical protein